MRLFSILPASLALVLAMPSMAQQNPARTPSVADYLCTFAHKCGSDAATRVETIDAPRTKGFRLARISPTPLATAPRNLAPARNAPIPTRRGYARGGGDVAAGGGGYRYAVPVATTAPEVAAGRPRADLMIGFELNSARLSAAGAASARIFAQSLMTPELAGKRFLIEGHTDLRGGRALNMDLSQRRAQAVADFLVAQGVDRARLTQRGLGPDVPLPGRSPNDPANRRVEAELGS